MAKTYKIVNGFDGSVLRNARPEDEALAELRKMERDYREENPNAYMVIGMTDADAEWLIHAQTWTKPVWSSRQLDTISEAASELGRMGGSVTSERKAASSAANGRKGGRPAKRIE